MKKTLATVLLFGCFTANAFGNTYQLGFVGGLNYSSYSFSGVAPYGFGAGGATTLTMNANSPIGFRAVFLQQYLNAANQATVRGAVSEGSLTIDANFDGYGDHLSIGVGYAVESQSGLTCKGACPEIPAVTTGPVFEFKEDHGKKGAFGFLQVFVPNDASRNRLHRIQTFAGFGFEFGRSK